MTEPLLKVSNIETYYGPITAIRGVSFDVPRGSIVTILGRQRSRQDHGAETVCGAMEPQKGTSPSRAARSRARARLGVRATASPMCRRDARSFRS